MADSDTSKTQKLASARKKFKELKKKKDAQKTTDESVPIPGPIKECKETPTQTPMDSLTSSTHSSVNNEFTTAKETVDTVIIQNENSSSGVETQLPNYFNKDVLSVDQNTFFDDINSNIRLQRNSGNIETAQTDRGIFNYPINHDTYSSNFNNYSFIYDTPYHDHDEDQKTQNSKQSSNLKDNCKDPKLNVNKNTYFENQSNDDESQTKSNVSEDPQIENVDFKFLDGVVNSHPIAPVIYNEPIPQYQSQASVNSDLSSIARNVAENAIQSPLIFEDSLPPPSQQVSSIIAESVIDSAVDMNTAPDQIVSNMENLLQLSNQMAQLIEPNADCKFQSEIGQLEMRNSELAALLEAEKLKTDQLIAVNDEYETKLQELESQLRVKLTNSNINELNEISRLRDELQTHVQTIGVLVGEKTELSAALNQIQITAKQKSTESEELQNRLKASRSRVLDLEKEVNTLRNEMSLYRDTNNKYFENFNQLRDENVKLKDEKEELSQDLLEVREKLKNVLESNITLQNQVSELTNHASLANIKIQQLTTSENHQIDSQVEMLVQEKFTLEKQVSDLTNMIKTLTKDKDDSSMQYQQYAQQLNSQLLNLASKLEEVQLANDSLVTQEQYRVKHIGELERQLQNLQSDHINSYVSVRTANDHKNELSIALENLKKNESEMSSLRDELTRTCNERDLLLNELETKKETITQLEDLIERLKDNQPDSKKLLTAMESDKIAAARAMAQNKDMKTQLEGMQEVFLKLNNDKVELTENLMKERESNKNLFDKLQKTESHLATLADAIEIKDRELSTLRISLEELNKTTLHHSQINDRLRHYEAQNHATNALQVELQEAQSTIESLRSELSNMKFYLEKAEDLDSKDSNRIVTESEEKHTSDESDLSEKHESEKDEVISRLKNQMMSLENKNKTLESEIISLREKRVNSKDNPNNNLYNSNAEFNELNILDKEAAMRHLEHKFLHTMDEIARLNEEKQHLEHLVLQLQGETETIGEYVALYQHQRSVLTQRAREKDQQLKQLASDRQTVKKQLEMLNTLFQRLIDEKSLPVDLLTTNEISKSIDESLKRESIGETRTETNNVPQGSVSSIETAERIVALLSEIKNSNLVQPSEEYNHCPWCSGQLITV